MSACPLQAVLFDFEDACEHLTDKEDRREITLVADSLRLGGAILGENSIDIINIKIVPFPIYISPGPVERTVVISLWNVPYSGYQNKLNVETYKLKYQL